MMFDFDDVIPGIPAAQLSMTSASSFTPPMGAMAIELEDLTLDPPFEVPSAMTMASLPPWRLMTNEMWRIAVWRRMGEPESLTMPNLSEVELPHNDRSTAQILPVKSQIHLEGKVGPGEGIDLFGVPVGPGTRSLDISYRRKDGVGPFDPERGGPIRVWLQDEQGRLIDSWLLGPEFDGLDLRMFSFVRPDPSMLYFGIEAVDWPEGGSASLSYTLDVQRGLSASPSYTFGPAFGNQPATGSDFSGGGKLDFGSAMMSTTSSATSLGIGPLNLSGGGGSGFGLSGVVSPTSIDLGNGLVRPLPTQVAASAGGLLAAGPEIRGNSDVLERLPLVEEDFTDLAELAFAPGEPSGSDDGSEEALVGRSRVDREFLTPRSGGFGSPPPIQLGASNGELGLPMLVAGLRIAWGRPATRPTQGELTDIPEELASMVAASPLELAAICGSGRPGPPSNRSQRRTDPPPGASNRAIGAAALAVGLILPDLASDRPSLRHPTLEPLRSWRRTRPRHS